ncbi:type II toxin-antitoxin system RelB/DinJ family antitoxin [Candidatus Venteria ishoeyi]|uniref:Antitoxin DinJ n=1 Tax=Candidatus Venteria ishoeyi TaxID=1899563 RepID=A0A1H6FG91_9GAMM|nr:type II toxin-antitoxin system RelB/DinJ family antitoxin [Candidatus Venteria ishoeyi]SEH09098.1 Antitoxin DinJ [Candidatus Venteria ishoeyi]
MSKTATIRARIEPQLKQDVETLFQHLGLTTSEAITLFYTQVALRKGLPFTVELPNTETSNTFAATDRDENLVECKNADDMFQKLGI